MWRSVTEVSYGKSFSLDVICSLFSVFLLIEHHSHWFLQEFRLDRDHRIRKSFNKCMHNHVFSWGSPRKQGCSCSRRFQGLLLFSLFVLFCVCTKFCNFHFPFFITDKRRREVDEAHDRVSVFSLLVLRCWMHESFHISRIWHYVLYRYWEDEKVRLDYRPVHMNTLDDEVEAFPPKARVY
jgi:hypothetical protein